jgi:outer membrane scaffolding protein for murein synthesis (MipA/OmpV family)
MKKTNHRVNQLSACLFSLFYLSHTALAKATNDPDAFIITGALNKNEFLGSDDTEIVPAIISEFKLLGSNIEVEGLTARVELYSNNNWHTGLTTLFDFGRNDEVSNEAVAAMKEIKQNFNLGAYLSNKHTNVFLNNDELELRIQTTFDASSVHEGSLTTLSSTYTLPLYIPWRFELELETSFANNNYINTYFGISQADSLASNLPQYSPSAGFIDVTLNANIILFSSPNWGAFTRLSYSRLINDAADSPIVKQGSANQSQLGLGVFYRF